MGFLTRCKRLFSFAFLLQNRNTFFSFFLKSFLILSEKQHPGRAGPARGAGAAEASQLKPQKPWPQRLLQPRSACRKSCAFAPSRLRTGPAAPFAAHGGLRRPLRSARLGTGPAGRRGVILGQHRTILSFESRRQIFWQVKQECSRILCVFASIFVTVAGKSASEATLKASAVNCAVLPWMKKGFPTPFWRHSPRGLHFAAQRCMALPPPAFSPDASFTSLFMEAFFRLCSPGGFNLLPAPCAHARKTPAAERAAPYLP